MICYTLNIVIKTFFLTILISTSSLPRSCCPRPSFGMPEMTSLGHTFPCGHQYAGNLQSHAVRSSPSYLTRAYQKVFELLKRHVRILFEAFENDSHRLLEVEHFSLLELRVVSDVELNSRVDLDPRLLFYFQFESRPTLIYSNGSSSGQAF